MGLPDRWAAPPGTIDRVPRQKKQESDLSAPSGFPWFIRLSYLSFGETVKNAEF
jgi:hypothetical protein